jgi:aminoglycoside phosphotransferase (APT) family kinase protein
MTPTRIGLLTAVFVAVSLTIGGAKAQQPTPPIIVVQAAGAVAPTATPVAAAAAAATEATLAAAIKALEQVKAANDATLKKQEAMLQQLDELQKAAEQLKVFTKRV